MTRRETQSDNLAHCKRVLSLVCQQIAAIGRQGQTAEITKATDTEDRS